MKASLKGKVALITGAAGGIGKSIANTFSANGARVIYVDLDFDAVRSCAAKAGKHAVAMRLDVANETEVNSVVAEIIELYGRLDIVVNNAGVNSINHRVNIDEYPTAEWKRILDVDLNGVFFVSRAAAKPMLRQKSGKIINISSVLGLVPARLQSPFVAAKAGVVNLTRAMALELGSRGILVNCIAPGSILTNGTRELFYNPDGKFKKRAKDLLSHIPLGRPGECSEVAHAALFLAAPESSYINGAVLTVDGGWLAGYIREF